MRAATTALSLFLTMAAYAQNEPAPQPAPPTPSPTALTKIAETPAPSRAQQLFGTAHPHAVAIFDVTADTRNLNKTLFFPVPTLAVTQQINLLKPKMTDAEATAVLDGLKKELAAASDRWISTKGDTVDIYVLYRLVGRAPDIQVKEEDRDTRLSTDLATLIKIIKNIAFAADENVIGVADRPYQLTKTRATLTITATQKVGDTPTTVSKSIITGPTEHLFLSADIPITKVKELKYDETNKTFATKDTPSLYHVGFDYTLGDVITTDQQQPWEALVFKALLKISRRPLDSYGVAIGYRSPNISLFGFTLQSFTPFVGYFRTKVADKDQSGNPITKQKNGMRVGISLNLDRAVDWTKKKN